MSVVGLDYGSASATMAVVRRGGIDIVQNQVSSRQTSSIVGFTEKQRALGEAGRTQAQRNIKNTVFWPKKILGRSYTDAALQAELPNLSGCKWVELPNDAVGAQVVLRDEQHVFSPEQINAMLLTELKKTCEGSTKVAMADVVASVPTYWTSRQRKALVDSGKIAGVNFIGLINDMSAAAINWGFYRTDITAPKKVVFVSMGASNFSANLCEFAPNQVTVLSAVQDAFMGGDDIDILVADKMAKSFFDKTKKNIKENQRAWYRLFLSAEKVKKNLNENENTSCGVECILDDRDLNEKLTRDELIALMKGKNYFDRVSALLQKVLDDAKVTKEQVDEVEWIGSGMRVSSIRDHVTQFFGGKRLGNTMNAEEAVAKGCALYCAMLSPLFKVRDYKLIDLSPYAVTLSWRTLGDETDTEVKEAQLFPVHETLGRLKTVTFNRNGKPFEFWIKYSDPASIPIKAEKDGIVGHYRISNVPKQTEENGAAEAEVKLKIKLDTNGIIQVVGADLIEKKEVMVDVPVTEEKKDGDKSDAPKTRQEKQTKTITTALTVETVSDYGLPAAKIAEFKKLEEAMKAKDDEAMEQANSKNAVETFIYNTRDKLGGAWSEFARAEETSKLNEIFEQTEDWLYNEGAEETTPVYKKRLADMKAIADPIAVRVAEWDTLPNAVNGLKRAAADLKSEAKSGKEQYNHIPAEELGKIVNESDHVLAWLNEGGKIGKFEARKKTDDPPFHTSDILARTTNLNTFAMKILSKPKPAPPKVDLKPADAKPADAKPADAKPADSKPAEAKKEAEPKSAEAPKEDPMDTVDS